MVDNFNLIRPLLDWGGEFDSIWAMIVLRKKDQTTTFGNKNNSARIIKSYNFYTVEQFNQKEEEIKQLCELFGGRAGIYLNKRNNKTIAHEVNRILAEYIQSGNFQNINGIVETAKGKHYPGDKIQFLDCDSIEEYNAVKQVLNDPGLRPYETNKLIADIPTNAGYHVVCRRFDKEYFKIKIKEIIPTFDFEQSLQIINPVALYYPLKNDIDKAAREESHE